MNAPGTAVARDPVAVWLRRQGRTQGWLAAQLGISQGMLSLIRHGRRVPNLEVALKIQARTGISPRSFLRSPSRRPAA